MGIPTVFKERINKIGRQQIESAREIIICKDNPYFIAKFGEKQSRFDPDPFIAIVIYNNNNNSLVSAGSFAHWRFQDLKNGIRSIKRINKDVPINIYSNDEIIKFVGIEKAESKAFMSAVRKFNKGEKGDLIALLEDDLQKIKKLSHD